MSLVLFLHGEHFTGMGGPFLERLGAGRDLHAPLYPGYDGTPPDPDFRSVDDLAYRYLDLLEELDERDAILVGASLGGWVALEMAVRDRSRIGRMALLAPVGVKLSGREERDFADLAFMPEAEAARALFHDP
ncbi:MAG: alpha/beta fold hydrolase, partial [Alphaproteobacteria bacterium]|nr:alpha/beta fold hydrolase [Alphaproteobacteria bacterium]